MPAPVVAPLAEPFADVRRIAVLRGGALGDLVFALPAIAALRAAHPDAELTLLGSPAHAVLLEGRGLVDEVVVLPPAVGVRGDETDEAAVAAFLARVVPVDLAVQLHGGGRHANPFLLRLGARHTVGTATPDATPLERTLHYDYFQHEVLRWLEVAGLAGAAPADLEPVLPVSAAERETGRRVLGDRPVVVLHPGATDPRRHWPAERFGAVAAAVAAEGVRTVVVGDPSEAALADRVVAAARAVLGAGEQELVRSIAGTLDLVQLLGVLAAADVVLANDSGPRHLAQAVGARTVGIFVFGNTINAMPFGRGRHRIRLGRITRCPVCGRDATQVGWTAERCEHDPSYVADVPVEDVLEDVRALLAP
ncbi:glycosyltransferase family 9 protein [Amnibacterium kyonggiense]|uniref:ADP-heptose:LPS heptosyltransferase n=1 Tax=Amnibacterium kyonggiense TaxID=595671 RepID=A0A4R7FFA9_9MICO|nr:glycosyltransferase family 9 protein [Amnibacterium kyonggiense]TDS76049.1 ADP-heptose:LPS heptosyltransferase [Amnibacterium kyonggiense]